MAELAAAAPRLDSTTLSGDALGVLCELLTLAMAQRESAVDSGSAADPVRGLRVTVDHAPGESTKITSRAGTLTLHDARLALSE